MNAPLDLRFDRSSFTGRGDLLDLAVRPSDHGCFRQPTKVQGRDFALEIACLGMTLPLTDIYRGIPTAEGR